MNESFDTEDTTMKKIQKTIVFAVLMGALVTLSAASVKAQSAAPNVWQRADEANDKFESGEDHYIVGCSLAASFNIPSCGELPSGRQFLNQDSADDDSVDGDSDDSTPEVDQETGPTVLDNILQEQQELQQQLEDASRAMYNTQRNLPVPNRAYIQPPTPEFRSAPAYQNPYPWK
jgi:hypothetical protein